MNEFDYSIIGDTTAAAAQATNAIIALMQSRRAAQQAREEQRKRDAFNKSMFNRQYYQDALSRSDTQNMLRNYRETMREAIKNQQNTAVVTGETPEAVAATKRNNAKAYADAVAGITAQNSARKDAALANYQNMSNQSYADWIKLYQGDAQNWSNFASQAFRMGAQQFGSNPYTGSKYAPQNS